MDIAYLAGVSQATVSRALRGSELVSKATRERILEVARQLNYRTDRNAANLRSQQTQTLALLIYEDPTSDHSHINPFFLSMLGTITREASRQGYDLLVSFQQLSEDWHTEYELSNRADGIILLGYGNFLQYEEKLRALVEADAHFVIWGPFSDDQPDHFLSCDNREGGRLAAQHLCELGRRRIVFVGSRSEGFPEFRLRFEGFRSVLEEQGIEFDEKLQVDCDNQETSGRRAIELLLFRGDEFDAVFCASDLIAIGVIQALRARGVDVPGDVSVVGFDDIPAAAYFNPPLTTIRQNTRLAGRMLVGRLLAQIAGRPTDRELVPVEKIVRESCSG